MGNLDFSIDGSDLVNSFYFRAQTSVDAESLSVDDGSDGEVVKDFSAVFPRIGITVFSVDFVVESVDGGDLSG